MRHRVSRVWGVDRGEAFGLTTANDRALGYLRLEAVHETPNVLEIGS